MRKKADIISRFRDECRKLLKDFSGRILVALSGGPDSVALLLALKEAGYSLEAVHCNFHLRGEESNRDMRFVEQFCVGHDIPLHIKEFDVEKERTKEESVEMACRRLRYELFRKLLKEKNLDYVAVGHNADDNVETLLMNLLRGSGTSGLKAMKQISGDLVRPLLSFSRREIEEFLKAEGQTYVTDHTNLESDFRRNFLRNEVIPLLESRWQGARRAIGNSIFLLQEENKIIENAIGTALDKADGFLKWKELNDFPSPLTLIFRFLQPYGGTTDIASEIVRSLPCPKNGKSWKLSETHRAISEREGLRIVDLEDETPDFSLEFKEIGREELGEFPKSNDIVFLPFPPETYEFVKARKNMKIAPLGMKGFQDVMKILKDDGVPAHKRENFPVLVEKESGEPIWIPGIKRSRLHLLGGTEKIVFAYLKNNY